MKPTQSHSHNTETLNVLGSKVAIHIHGRDTGGSLSVVEVQDEPGSGPPPHIHHREDETFHVLDGEYEFTIGEETLKLAKGATVFAPRQIPHTFRCVGQAAGRLLVTMTPAGFEGFFEEVGALSPQEQQPPRVIEIGLKYGLKFLPPAGS